MSRVGNILGDLQYGNSLAAKWRTTSLAVQDNNRLGHFVHWQGCWCTVLCLSLLAEEPRRSRLTARSKIILLLTFLFGMRQRSCALHSSCLQPPAPAAHSSQHRKVPRGLEARDFCFPPASSRAIQLYLGGTAACVPVAASCKVLCSILECLQWCFEQLVTSPARSYPNELLNCFLLVNTGLNPERKWTPADGVGQALSVRICLSWDHRTRLNPSRRYPTLTWIQLISLAVLQSMLHTSIVQQFKETAALS